MEFTTRERKVIQSRINNHRQYDKQRFGTNATTLTYVDFLELYIEQKGKCYWSDKQMSIESNQLADASLDRLDNDKPHTKENCILVMRALNLGRNDATLAEWVEYLSFMGLLSEANEIEYQQYLKNNKE